MTIKIRTYKKGELPKDLTEEQLENYKNYRIKNKGKMENANNYINIWKSSPSFNDINSKLSMIKVGFIGGIFGIITILSYIIFKNLLISILVSVSCLILFIISFHDQMFYFKNLISMKLRSACRIEPLKDLRFWMINSKPDVLLYTNIKDKMTVGLKVFQVKIVAENVDPNYTSFIKALSNDDIPFTYQIIQQPLLGIHSQRDLSNVDKNKSAGSLRTIINFCTYYDVKGTNKRKIGYLLDVLDMFAASLDNAFKSNYRHFEIKLLKRNKLINSLFTMFSQVDPNDSDEQKFVSFPSLISFLLKLAFLIVITLYVSILLEILAINYIIIITITIIFNILFIYLFWRELIFLFSRLSTFHQDGITHINPFKGINFYYYKKFPDCIFTLVNDKLLIGSKIFNHSHIIPPFLDSRQNSIAKIGKFFEALIPSKIPLSFTYMLSPLRFSTFENLAWDFLLRRTQNEISRKNNNIKREQFMKYRYGIFRTIITMGIHEIIPIKKFSMKAVVFVEDALYKHQIKVMSAFSQNIDNHHGIMLKGNKQLSGYLFECIKSKFFRLNGTHLKYLIIQGLYLAKLITIYPDFKKGINTKIAAEFNTPLPLKNFITLGHSINTEFYSKETEAGFRKDQLSDILIMGGSNETREVVMMKLAVEMIQKRVPLLIFDYSGKWSKLLNYFKGTRYDEYIEFFQLGTSFSLNLINSDIPYDQNNAKYINYMLLALSLAFNKDEREIDTFRAQLRKNDYSMDSDKSITLITEDLKNNYPWEKKSGTESVMSLFEDFISQDMDTLCFSSNTMDSITTKDFIMDDSNIIIDFSKIKDLRKKVFASLIILSKIIHHIENNKSYDPKIVLFPNLDFAFHAKFLDKIKNYGKVDSFFEPLRNSGFGIIASLESISILHPHVYPYFHNYITLQTTNIEDIKKIEKQMNFRNLHGTGIFGKERKEAFQREYLINLKPREVIIKRHDIEQPFPLKLEVKKLVSTPIMTKEEIFEFMREHGHDMEHSEQKIIERAKKILFKKDLEHYFAFIDEIIGFMDATKTVEKVSGNYENILKEELLKFITPRANKILGTNKKKRRVIEFRNDIFKILLQHGYLIENHPLHASGSESIRTSYSIGPQYEKALNEYNKMKKEETQEYMLEIIAEGDYNNEYEENVNDDNELIEKNNSSILLQFISSELGTIFNYLFQIHRYIKLHQYRDAQELEEGIIDQFLERIYFKLKNIKPTKDNINVLINNIVSLKNFPLDIKNFEELINKCHKIRNIEQNIEQNVTTLYDQINNFFHIMSSFVSNSKV